jgi:hypothetical protein
MSLGIGDDDLDWAVGELLQLWAAAFRYGTTAYRLSTALCLECEAVIKRQDAATQREIGASFEQLRKRYGYVQSSPSGGVSPSSSRGTSPASEGGRDSGREGGSSLGIPAGRPCELSALPLFSESASAASDSEEGG